MKSDVIVSLIKEIVKTEVKQQVKEEIIKMVKSGVITLNTENKSTPSLTSLTETKTKSKTISTIPPTQPKKEFTKNSVLNEILNQTQPFTAQQRAEGGSIIGGSVLDNIQRESEDDWGTIDMRNQSVEKSIETNPEMDAVTKALNRDYTELVKRFK